jgi:hypothetical protein
VLDDVERRRLLVQPARKNAFPVLVGLLHVELDERAGQLLFLPRSSGLAGPQAHDHVFPAYRLPGVKRDVLDDAVALVEYAEHRDALRHRRYAALSRRGRRHLAHRCNRRVLLLRAFSARGQGKCDQQRCGGLRHAYSGIQGS